MLLNKSLEKYIYHNDDNFVILQGDCLEILPLFDDKYFDLCLTSPPYNKDKDYIGYKDSLEVDTYKKFIFDNIDLLLKKTKSTFYNIQNFRDNDYICFDIGYNYKKYLINTFVWVKVNPPCNNKGIANGYEYLFFLSENDEKVFNFTGHDYMKNYIITPVNSNNKYSDVHNACFPYLIPYNFVKYFSYKNQIILDCFAGTGTTGDACLDLSRKCVLIEKEVQYCTIIKERLLHKKNSLKSSLF